AKKGLKAGPAPLPGIGLRHKSNCGRVGRSFSPSLAMPDHATKHAIQIFLKKIASEYNIAGAVLFGSRARGDNRPDSDADLAVLLKGEHQEALSTALAMADAAYDVLLETGINISPLPVWLDQWADPEIYSNPDLLRNVAREGVRL